MVSHGFRASCLFAIFLLLCLHAISENGIYICLRFSSTELLSLQPLKGISCRDFYTVSSVQHRYSVSDGKALRKVKWCHRPCVYYANKLASFHCQLVGDLLFKLNPGPINISGGPMRSSVIPVHTTNRPSMNNGYCSRRPNYQCSNLINIPLIASHQLTNNKGIKLCLVNAQSLRNKTADFSDYVTEFKFDLVALVKTWFTMDDVAMRAHATPEGYKLMDQPRASRSAGGTGLLFRDSLQVTMVASGELTSFEFSEWLVVSGTYRLRVVVIYRVPYSVEHLVSTNVFFTEFSDYMETVIMSTEKLVILGDFNIHIDVPSDVDARKLQDLFNCLGLEQHVREPTHTRGHTLDLIISRKCQSVIDGSPRVDRLFSDHFSVVCGLQMPKPTVSVTKHTYRNLKGVNIDQCGVILLTQSCASILQMLLTT